MKNNLKLAFLSVSFTLVSISLFFIPKGVEAQEENKQWIEVKCDDLNGTVDCNDCTSGTKKCYDNSCTACYGSTAQR